MGKTSKWLDPTGFKQQRKKEGSVKNKEQRAATAAATAASTAAAKETAIRRSARRRSIYGYGGIFGGSTGADSEAVVRTRRLLGT